MRAISPDPNRPESKVLDSISMLLLWIFAFLILLLTLPGCHSDDQKQQYRPYYDPPSKRARPTEKIRKPIQGAADRVDEVLEKTPVPAVAGILANDALDMIEKVETITVQEPDPEVVEIIEPKPDSLYEVPEDSSDSDRVHEDQSESNSGTVFLVFIALMALIYLGFKLLKGLKREKPHRQ
ncbi:hypothetical protein [Gimesia aquarii]|uniref:Uncharacterized protein n=1 Tax=Gimesia aquarii TaxID=2527964 RepID=A0A517W3S6_9PLAN|nr:hypothetical protein [Gimesia aquarii]QDT99904.1 hypothetical protein V144x_54180 [Gimesia aquarii]